MSVNRTTEILEEVSSRYEELGNISIDSSGKEAFNGIFGERYTALRQPKFSFNFNYPIDTRETITTVANGGTAAIVSNLLTIQSSTAINGSAVMNTRRSLRYSAGRDAEAMFTAIFTKGGVGSHLRVGLFDTLDGFYVGFENGVFGVTVRRDGVNIFVPQTEFSHDTINGLGKSEFLYAPTNINIFRITYGYLGIAPCFYQIYGGHDKGWITFHVHDVVNKQTTTHIKKPYLPYRGEAVNTGNATNVKLEMGSAYAGVIDGAGFSDSSSREFTKKRSAIAAAAGTDLLVMIFHNKATYGSEPNKIEDLLLKVGIGVESNKPVLLNLYKLETAPTGATFTDVDAANSNMETSVTGTFTLVGAQPLDSWALSKTGSININTRELNYLLLPNEYAIFTYSAAGTVDYDFTNRWSELF